MDKKCKELIDNLSDYWNTRIIKRTIKGKMYNGKEYEETYYGIHEVYYDKNDKPVMWSENPKTIVFENKEDLESLIKQIKDAKRRTILEEKNNKLIDTNIKL